MVRTVYYGLWLLPLYWALTNASVGDRLPEFKECVEVREPRDCVNVLPTTSRLAHVRTVKQEIQCFVRFPRH